MSIYSELAAQLRFPRHVRCLLVLLTVLVLFIWRASVPAGTRIDSDEEVAFLGSYVFRGAAGDLRVVLHGHVFEAERSSSVRRATVDRLISPGLFRYMDKRPIDFDVAARELMHERLIPFLYDGESRVTLGVRIRGAGGEAVLRLPRTAAGGYFAVTRAAVGNRTVADLVGGGAELSIGGRKHSGSYPTEWHWMPKVMQGHARAKGQATACPLDLGGHRSVKSI
jgi:hypothetical protein